MIKSIILSLGLTVILSPGVPSQCQADSGQKTWTSHEVIRSTPPLMKITPQGAGKFLLEPLTAPPKTTSAPLLRPPRKAKSTGPVSVPPTSQKINMATPWDIAQMALAKVRHARYIRGASLETSSATDCSGFTRYIYHLCKINLPRTSAEQAQVGQVVTHQMDFSKLQAGDLLFFRDGGLAVGHVGLYLGEGKMIHAASSRGGVTVSELDQGYYVNNFVVAKRIFKKKYYKWPTFPGLSAADRNWDLSVAIAAPLPMPRPASLFNRLLKLFWPRGPMA